MYYKCNERHLFIFVAAKLLKKYYDVLWKSFPADIDATIKKIDVFHQTNNTYPYNYFKIAPDISSANQRILDTFIIVWYKSDNVKGLITFLSIISTIIGDSVAMRNFQKGKIISKCERYKSVIMSIVHHFFGKILL